MVERFSDEWKTVKLGEVLSVKRGKRVVRSQLSIRGKFPAFQNSLTPLREATPVLAGAAAA